MYLTPTEKHWTIDVECDGLKPTKVWCLSYKNAITKQKGSFTDYEKIRRFIDGIIRDGGYVVGHNIVGYDAPVLNRLVGTRIPISRIVDTFLLSSVFSPSIRGGHSIEAWAERLGRKKPAHEDWSQFSPEMLHRNQTDVEIQHDLFIKLTRRMRDIGISERCCEIEHLAWNIIQNKQKKAGFPFDAEKAHVLFSELRKVEGEVQDEIYHVFPPELRQVATYKRPYKADGTPTANYRRHLEAYPKIEITADGGYQAFDLVEFNLGSPKQRVGKLLELGWIPEEFTPTGQPKPTAKGDLVPSLARFCDEGGPKEVRLIADWIAINARGNAVGNWLDLYNPETGGIHGNLWLANTLRYRHDHPNTANIPSVRKRKLGGEEIPLLGREGFYTYEARDLWTCRNPDTRNLVGIDAIAIQFRVLANALDDEEFTKVILSGDIHEYNREKTGIGNRDQNKTFGYAALLGAGAEKTGTIFGVGKKEGGQIKNKWIKTVPGLKALYGRLEDELKVSGRIPLCDGARVLVSSPHMVLAYLLQGDESRLMKQAMIYVDERVRREGFDVVKVGDIHDEWQSDCKMDDTERYIKICHGAFRDAGESFDYHIPIDCSGKVGKTWAQTH